MFIVPRKSQRLLNMSVPYLCQISACIQLGAKVSSEEKPGHMRKSERFVKKLLFIVYAITIKQVVENNITKQITDQTKHYSAFLRTLPKAFRMLSFVFCLSLAACGSSASSETVEVLSEVKRDLRYSVLEHLNLEEAPRFTKEDFQSFQVPLHMKKKYEALLWKHNMRKDSAILRKKRSEPSLAGLFKSVHKNPSISGNVIYTDSFREKLQFDMEERIPDGSRITIAQLRLFKKLPNFQNRLSTFQQFRSRTMTNRHDTARRRAPKVKHARVSVYHTLTHVDGSEESLLIDSRMIMVNGSGWQSFDITAAVKQWQEHPVKYMTITLELRVDSSRPGRAAAEVAKMVRFTGQRVDPNSPRRPELVVFTEEEEKINTNDCKRNSNSERRKCCREKNYINFREMGWTQYWIIEPAGYEAYNCAGRCKASHRRGNQGAPRSCAVAESAPLPVMYLVKRGDLTEVEISEFPNMIVEKCGCSLDSVFVV
ncbi:left-right determination factor 1-like [Clavelina lepadiformis]|uniref:left-right determination factor 1-like n=1 Tax=Clavelina lepadiformis TaxID=159417 RepID=UPI004041904A